MARWISIFPLHGTGRFVVLTDVSQELSVQIRNGSEYASGDDVALDFAEPQRDLIQPRRVGRSEVQMNLGMHCQEVRDRPALVSREVVGDHMDLFAAGLIDHNVCEERGELRRGVPRSGFTEHLASLGVEGGVRASDKALTSPTRNRGKALLELPIFQTQTSADFPHSHG